VPALEKAGLLKIRFHDLRHTFGSVLIQDGASLTYVKEQMGPTAGTNYTLIDGASATYWWPEYWIQTAATLTAGNYVRSSDTWTDMMAAFRPVTAGSFTISASPTSLSIAQGNQGTSTVTTAISGGFNNSISLAASGMPAGTTVSFNPSTIPAPGSGNSTMTITVGSTTQMGTYPITVTGTGGGIYRTATVNLTVTAQVALSWTASQSPGVAGYNIYRSMTSGGPYTLTLVWT